MSNGRLSSSGEVGVATWRRNPTPRGSPYPRARLRCQLAGEEEALGALAIEITLLSSDQDDPRSPFDWAGPGHTR
ncbi:hypothetical protein ACFZC7_10010 [Streptomyces massasporeus]|uniref:hypothetical protein n=1 Tax=Streptomyces massasporeus TaxID=67324 RepID=UPI0036EDDDC3